MNKNDRRILAKACGLCWHEWNPGYQNGNLVNKINGRYDGWNTIPMCLKCNYAGVYGYNPTFTLTDDWELVRVKVVRNYRGVFAEFIGTDIIRDDGITAIRWWLTQSPEELCRLAADFIKSRPDLFPWVEEMEEVKE